MSPHPTKPKQRAKNQLARTFPPFPPAPGRRGGFTSAWWGQAWVSALEECSLDSGRLTRGRTYARRGSVGEMTVLPGRISAPVQGSRPRPYRVSLAIPVLNDAEWDRLLDAVAARAGHIAALLDRDMPTELVKDALAAGVRLLPSANDLEPSCSCPDWGYPCKHGAALCYQVARLLDEDPFVLLLMRGRGEHQLLDELAHRNAARAATEMPALASASVPSPRTPTGTPAREAFAARAGLPPLPEPQRAHRQLAAALADDTPQTPADLTEWQDAVRIAAEHPQIEVFARIAQSTDRPLSELAQAVRAWRHGGIAALEVLQDSWTPDPSVLARARASLTDDWADGRPPQLRAWRNRWTVVGLDRQLRYGRDGRWYPYGKEGSAWWPIGPPDADPATALAALLGLQGRPSSWDSADSE
ncbi:SWIM zinc finger family protein [Streptomyces sp. NBC_00233]|uniref:SWIM zinc finger family protein n=1 Tax=Streptomyces sp. NBC_00233 TaxID=2975686 RepID=UPI0022507C71|nr:SWIM zinc finger family protein [Streptomyces sp. NBC_00233]MCX5233548.1 SWIM zinc finger family protein [Streptomyces sp. NBC_00233]